MASTVRKSELTARRRHLVEVMQEANYACIEHLEVRDGEPVFTENTRVVLKVKFGAPDKGARPEARLVDTELKRDTVEMLAALAQIGNGTVRALSVTAGLPSHMEVLPDRLPGAR